MPRTYQTSPRKPEMLEPLYPIPIPPRPVKPNHKGYVTDTQIAEVLKAHGLEPTGNNYNMARNILALKDTK